MSDTQRLIPYLAYADAPGALRFLADAFGFKERYRMEMPDGRIGHAEMAYGESVLFLASEWRETGLRSPAELPGVHTQIYCVVDDADQHYAQAREAGATVIAEPSEQHGSRMYRALDLEGHRWMFAQPLKTNGDQS